MYLGVTDHPRPVKGRVVMQVCVCRQAQDVSSACHSSQLAVNYAFSVANWVGWSGQFINSIAKNLLQAEPGRLLTNCGKKLPYNKLKV
jgi:hypothetical protein